MGCAICKSEESLTTIQVVVDRMMHDIVLCNTHFSGLLRLLHLPEPVQIIDQTKPQPIESQSAKPQAVHPIKTPSTQSKQIPKPKDQTYKLGSPSLNVKQTIASAVEAAKARGVIDKNVKVAVPEVAKVEMQTVAGRDDVPMTIIRNITDADGSQTTISIVKTSDVELQRRAKELEAQTRTNFQDVHTFQKGYATSECAMCRGKGQTMNKPCPKCKGKGII